MSPEALLPSSLKIGNFACPFASLTSSFCHNFSKVSKTGSVITSAHSLSSLGGNLSGPGNLNSLKVAKYSLIISSSISAVILFPVQRSCSWMERLSNLPTVAHLVNWLSWNLNPALSDSKVWLLTSMLQIFQGPNEWCGPWVLYVFQSGRELF